MKRIHVTVEGQTPLLQHRYAIAGQDEPSSKRTGVPEWKAEGEKALYRDESGNIYQPAEHFERAFAEAGKQFKVAGKRGATWSKLLSATLEVQPFAIPHKVTKYEIDARPVVIQKSRVVRYRPRFDAWQLSFDIVISDVQVPVTVVRQVVDYAGTYIGIGDYRPNKGGKFGKFAVTHWEEA